MNKNDIMAILQDWNGWQKDFVTGVPRPTYLSKLIRFLHTNQITTIMGPRRAGKSYIMRQAAASLIKENIDPKDILIVNFEDPRWPELDLKLLENIYQTYLEYIAPKGKPYIFLDEIQEIPKWEKWTRMMHELSKAKMVVSGSNANLLSRELGTVLTGRHLDLNVLPLSFREFLTFNNMTLLNSVGLLGQAVEIRGLLRKYFEYGSFPEVVLNESKKEILLNYFEDIIEKDIIRRYRIRKAGGLKSLVKFYFSNPSAHVTFTSIAKFIKISPDSVERFSGYLEGAYVVSLLKRFSFKVKEQEKSPRKVYAVDTGLCNAVGFRFSENLGKLAKNLVFLELKRRQLDDPQLEIFYWKDGQEREVDFVIKHGLKVDRLIQVCWDVTELKTREREIKSLLKASEEFAINKALVITDDEESEEKIKGVLIKYIPLWKWLLFDEKEIEK